MHVLSREPFAMSLYLIHERVLLEFASRLRQPYCSLQPSLRRLIDRYEDSQVEFEGVLLVIIDLEVQVSPSSIVSH